MAERTYGYVGKIARINLTDKSVALIPTSKYVPKYIGGRSVCNKIFWDEVKPGVKAFDPENKLIYMTGATTATGIPTGGRTVFTGISPKQLPRTVHLERHRRLVRGGAEICRVRRFHPGGPSRRADLSLYRGRPKSSFCRQSHSGVCWCIRRSGSWRKSTAKT